MMFLVNETAFFKSTFTIAFLLSLSMKWIMSTFCSIVEACPRFRPSWFSTRNYDKQLQMEISISWWLGFPLFYSHVYCTRLRILPECRFQKRESSGLPMGVPNMEIPVKGVGHDVVALSVGQNWLGFDQVSRNTRVRYRWGINSSYGLCFRPEPDIIRSCKGDRCNGVRP